MPKWSKGEQNITSILASDLTLQRDLQHSRLGLFIYCKATIFGELLNLAKLAMTHETLNLLALNVRSKFTLYSSKSI